MFDLRKAAVAALALTSSAVIAGTMGPVCTPGNVTVPCEKRAWDLSAFALYLRPTFGNDLTYLNRDYFTNGAASAENYTSINKWNWGFKLEGSYHFNTGNDITLDWYHISSNNSYNISSSFTNQVNIKWDAVNAEFAQYVDFSSNQKMRFHGGVTYARINGSDFSYLNNNTSNPNTWNTDFNGFGPRTGLDLNYAFGNGLEAYAKGAGAILIGHGNFSTYDSNFNPVYGTRDSVVPELDAQLGAMYTHPFTQGDFIINAGWMWTNYFLALHRSNVSCDANFSVSGPFIGLNYVGYL